MSEKTRLLENQQEFKEATQLSLHLRHSLALFSNRFNSLKLNNTLVKRFIEAIKLDTTNTRGQRKLKPENLNKLKGLVLSDYSSPQLFIYQGYKVTIEGTTTLKAKLQFSGDLIPTIQFKKIEGATHIQLSVALLSLDFLDLENPTQLVEQSKYYDLSSVTNDNLAIETAELTPNVTDCQLALVFISYYQEVNGVKYPFEGRNTNAGQIVTIKTTI